MHEMVRNFGSPASRTKFELDLTQNEKCLSVGVLLKSTSIGWFGNGTCYFRKTKPIDRKMDVFFVQSTKFKVKRIS